jgi:hypothetical protein
MPKADEPTMIKCPLCHRSYQEGFHALSRRDNETHICPVCGTREALEDYLTAEARAGHNLNLQPWD